MRTLTTIVLLFSVTLISGCGGSKLPADWEKTYPCTVRITKNGEPLTEAVVVLARTDKAHGSWAVGGTTDASGAAVIHTSCIGYSAPGAPVGEYRIIVTKNLPPMPSPLSAEELEKLDYGKRTEHYAALDAEAAKRPPLVLPQYSDAEKSPLTIKVGKEGSEGTFDVGK